MTTDHTLLHTTSRYFLGLTLGLIVALAGASAAADEALDEVSSFDIAPQPLADALLEFSQQANVQIVMVSATTKDMEAEGIVGERTNREALELLLDDQGLRYTQHDGRTVSIQTEAVTEDLTPGKYRPASSQILLAQTSAPQSQETRSSQASSNNDEAAQAALLIDEIIVTGTNIRGSTNLASPVFVFDQDDIRQSGAATTQDFVRTLPQNLDFSESSASGLTGEQTGFAGSGAGVNIRGLGASATLTLVNGRRLAASAGTSTFVDISLIPLSAIERVEVLTDGASSIYGADAVAGVVNFILKDDFDGAETRLRLGTATDGRGSPTEFQVSQTVGKAWNTGNLLASYEYYRRNNLDSSDRSFTAPAEDPTDLLGSQQRHSVLLHGHQELSPGLSVFGTGNFSTNENTFNITLPGFGTTFEEAETDQYGGTFGAELALSSNWQLEAAVGYNKNQVETTRINNVDADFSLLTVDVIADGPLFDVPGGEARVAIGGQFRSEDYDRTLESLSRGTEIIDLDRDVYAIFGELNLPIVGEPNRRPGIYALDITAAGRFEDFSDFGSSTNPKVGIRYAPIEGLNFRGTYGTSFQAPRFADLGLPQNFSVLPGFFFPPAPGSTDPAPAVASIGGGNLDLQPETSRNWTAGVDYAPTFLDGVSLSVTYFDIKFEDRVGRPGPGLFSVFTMPEAFGDALTLNPDPSAVDALFSNPLFQNPFGVLPGDVGVILDERLQNLAVTEVNGLDIAFDFSKETAIGNIALNLNGSYLFDFTDQASLLVEPIETLDTFGNPTNWRFRSSLGWSNDGYNAVVFVNHVDDYTNILGVEEIPVDSWTTVDINLSYDTSFAFDGGLLEDTRIGLNVQNIFNEDPPFVEQAFNVGVNFDGANANALGRYISLNVSKSW